MRYLKNIITVLFVLPLSLFAQDITGLWKGTLYNDTTQQYYKYEIGISKEKGKYIGFSHTWFLLDDKQYFGVKKVKIKIADDGKIIVEDDGLISNNYPVPPSKNVRQLNILTLDASDSIMKLNGSFSTNRTKDYRSLTGTISLQRKNDFWQSALVPHLKELEKENELSFVKEETEALAKVETQQKIAAEQKGKEEVLQQQETAKAVLIQQQAEIKLQAEQKKLADKQMAADELAKQEAIKQQEIEKEKARKLLAKQEAEAKTLAEKEKLREEFAKQQAAKALEIEKENVAKAEAKKTAEAKAIAEKASIDLAKKQQDEKAAALLAKQQADKKLLEEKEKSVQKEIALAAANKNVAAASVSKRTTVLQQTVSFTSDSLQLSLYDNGEVDGDTVSVLMNGELILARQGLSTTAIKKTIYIPSGSDRIELVMYAESLGSIPPNTGLLVIRDGKSLYEVRFSGDLQKNASIVFNRKKE